MPEPTHRRRNVPSVIARLMGMEAVPSEIRPAVHSKNKRNKNPSKIMERKEIVKTGHYKVSSSKDMNETKQGFLPLVNGQDPDHYDNHLGFTNSLPKKHIQEEQLQKFKKEFEAWEASRGWERSSSVELQNSPGHPKNHQSLLVENLHNGMMTGYTGSRWSSAYDMPLESKAYMSQKSAGKIVNLESHEYNGRPFQPIQKEGMIWRNKSKSHDFDRFSQMKYDDKFCRPSLPTKIVILTPGSERTIDIEESWGNSPDRIKDESSTGDLLEKVKKRLKFEIEGHEKQAVTVRGNEVEIPFLERPTDPKEIARQIAKKVRESVMRELRMNLVQSESNQLYESEAQISRRGLPNFIKKDKGKFLLESRNNPRNGKNEDIPTIINRSTVASSVDSKGRRMRTLIEASKGTDMISYQRNVEGDHAYAFGHEQREDVFETTEDSPGRIVRSLSAPVSGTSLAKLLSTEPNILPSARMMRKHESLEEVFFEERKTSKHRIGFGGKVSKLKYNFTLRGKLFGRKFQSVEESGGDDIDMTKAFMNAPSVLMNYGIAQENSTEVPPSPASFCSSPLRFSKPGDHPSPVSTLDVPFIDDQPMPQVFREINANLHELRWQLDQLQLKVSQEVVVKEGPLEPEMLDLEDESKSYIREVLVAAGLLDQSAELSYPIHTKVFEEVEATYKRRGHEGEGGANHVDHKLLFNLLNEALLSVLRPPITRIRLGGTLGPTLVPHGKDLLDKVWRIIHIYLCPSSNHCHSIDEMSSRDLERIPWLSMMHEETNFIGRAMENMILGELVHEIMKDILC